MLAPLHALTAIARYSMPADLRPAVLTPAQLAQLTPRDKDGAYCGADFSRCRTWRYALYRVWDAAAPPLVTIGLNPSTADEQTDDNTVRRCIRYSRDWGFGGLVMLNLFGFRDTNPRGLYDAHARGVDPVGPRNSATILHECRGRTVLCAWGAHGAFLQRADAVRRLLREVPNAKPVCLGLTQAREPRHPLYLSAALQPEAYT